jgi:hypothetical protein
MTEKHDDEARPPAAEAGQGEAAPEPETAYAQQGAGTPPAAPPPGDGRFRRWSRSTPAQFVAVGLIAGLVGGLVGGGIVAAASGGDDRDHAQLVRIEGGVPPWWGPRMFRRPPPERFFPMRPDRPDRQEEPVPRPTATS